MAIGRQSMLHDDLLQLVDFGLESLDNICIEFDPLLCIAQLGLYLDSLFTTCIQSRPQSLRLVSWMLRRSGYLLGPGKSTRGKRKSGISGVAVRGGRN